MLRYIVYLIMARHDEAHNLTCHDLSCYDEALSISRHVLMRCVICLVVLCEVMTRCLELHILSFYFLQGVMAVIMEETSHLIILKVLQTWIKYWIN